MRRVFFEELGLDLVKLSGRQRVFLTIFYLRDSLQGFKTKYQNA